MNVWPLVVGLKGFRNLLDPPRKTSMTMEKQPFEDVYIYIILLKMVVFQCHVSELRGVHKMIVWIWMVDCNVWKSNLEVFWRFANF